MSTYRSGSNLSLVLARESSYNTPGAAGNQLPKSSLTIPGPRELISNNELRSDPNPVADEKGLQTGTGFSMVMPMTSNSFGLMCHYFFGDDTVTATADPFDHVYTITNDAIPTFTLEVGDTGLTKYDQYNGVTPTGMSFSISKTSSLFDVNWTLQGSGKYTLNGGAPLDAAPDSYDDRRHVLPGCTVTIGGAVTYVTGIDVSIMRRVDAVQVLDGLLYASNHEPLKYTYDITVTGFRNAADDLFGLDDDSEKTVGINTVRPGSANYDVDFEFEETYVYATEGYSVSDDGLIPFQARISPFYADGANASSVMITANTEIEDYSAV